MSKDIEALLKEFDEQFNGLTYYPPMEDAYEDITKFIRLALEQTENKGNEYKTQLEAWQRIFGTTQLSHASERLNSAERSKEKIEKTTMERCARELEPVRDYVNNHGQFSITELDNLLAKWKKGG